MVYDFFASIHWDFGFEVFGGRHHWSDVAEISQPKCCWWLLVRA